MWIVCLALRRTYTFGVLPVRIAILGAVSTNRMATDVLPEADVSVVSIAWQYSGMLPMSLGLGEGGEQNVPLGRAVIGGLLVATVLHLVLRPGRVQPAPPPPAGGRGDGHRLGPRRSSGRELI